MDFIDVVAARKSVRGYSDKPVEEEKTLFAVRENEAFKIDKWMP